MDQTCATDDREKRKIFSRKYEDDGNERHSIA